MIDGCGHLPNLEKPGEFNQAIINFLEKRRTQTDKIVPRIVDSGDAYYRWTFKYFRERDLVATADSIGASGGMFEYSLYQQTSGLKVGPSIRFVAHNSKVTWCRWIRKTSSYFTHRWATRYQIVAGNAGNDIRTIQLLDIHQTRM